MQTELHLQSNHNGYPSLTVPKLITIYLFGQIGSYFKKHAIYDFINHYWRAWFPHLPGYQAFARRQNFLENNFQSLFGYLLEKLKEQPINSFSIDYIIDSILVMLDSGVKSRCALVARKIASAGFYATRQIHFKASLKERGIQLPTPIKKPKYKELSTAQKHYNKLVSMVRQPMKSFFKWLIDKTAIKEKVRCIQRAVYCFIIWANFHLPCFY